MAISIRDYLADKAAIEAWLAEERARAESREAYLGHWQASPQHLGVAFVEFTKDLSGEFHATSDGKVSMFIARGPENENPVFEADRTVANEYELKLIFRTFRDRFGT